MNKTYTYIYIVIIRKSNILLNVISIQKKKIFQCEECHRSMSHASSLVRHYKLVHHTKRTLSQIEEKTRKKLIS